MASAYCATTDIEFWLPSDHGQSANLATFVAQASGIVNSRLRPVYRTPLPDYNGTPATPDDIRRITHMIGGHLALLAECVTNRMNDTSSYQNLIVEAMAELDRYVSQPPTAVIPPEIISGEAISFESGDPLLDDEYKFTHATRRIIPETVAISGYEWGVDFEVHYEQRLRGWVLVRLDPDLSGNVSYEFEYYPNDMEKTTRGPQVARVRRA